MKHTDFKTQSASAPSRREFLKQTAAAAPLAASVLAVERSAYAAGSGTIRVGMIGCGDRCSGAAAQALQTGPDVHLVAMCDIFQQRIDDSYKAITEELQAAARRAPQGGAIGTIDVPPERRFLGFDGWKHVIELSDVVLIACASKYHPLYAEAAIQAGKHVFVEKPHGIDPVGVRRMQAVCDLARQKGLSIVSGLHSRYNPAWQETIRRIHDGIIGNVVAVQSMFLRQPYRVYKREPAMSETEYQYWNWYHFRWLSGDDVTQSLVHNMDRVSWILREEMPQWAFGLAGRSSSFGEIHGDMFDHHTVVYEYAGGARVYALCRTQAGCYNRSSDIVMGTKGTCDLGNCAVTGETNWRYEGPKENAYQVEQSALFQAIRRNEPVNSGAYMNNSTMVAVMGQMACFTGEKTEWPAVHASTLQFGPTPEASSFKTPPPSVPDKTGNYPLLVPGVTKLL